jgi:hypothetical protein
VPPLNAAFDPGGRRRDPVPRRRPQRRSLRSPELHRRPRTAISLKRSRRRRRHHHRAATSRCTNQAARAGRDAPRRILRHHPPRDKEHQLASRKCRRESTPQRKTLSMVNAPGRRRRRPRGSPAAASSVAPIARAPSSPRTGISLALAATQQDLVTHLADRSPGSVGNAPITAGPRC